MTPIAMTNTHIRPATSLIGTPAAVLSWSMGVIFSMAIALRIVAGRREENRIARETNDLKL